MYPDLHAFERNLVEEEKSAATVSKYVRDVERYIRCAGEEVSKETVLEWKHSLIEQGYSVRSVNSMLASLNAYLRYIGREDCRVKSLRAQRQIYCPEEKELTREEYLRLLEASKNRPRLHLLLQTIGGTGIRISELKYFTLEAAREGEVRVYAKGKSRVILLPSKLRRQLTDYCRAQGIGSGAIFRTRGGLALDRSNVWAEMKGLCAAAGVNPEKVFPHNLRKLFARSFYGIDRDIARLADILGHSSIDTTRIYIVSSGNEHRRKLESMRLVI